MHNQRHPGRQEVPTGNPFLRYQNTHILAMQPEQRLPASRAKRARTWSDVYNDFVNDVRGSGFWNPEYYRLRHSQCRHFRLIKKAVGMLEIIEQSTEPTKQHTKEVARITDDIADALGQGRPAQYTPQDDARSYAEWRFLDHACFCGNLYLAYVNEATSKTYGRFELPRNGFNNNIDIKSILKAFPKIEDAKDLEATWKDLYYYGEVEDWSHRAYEQALRMVLSGDLREVYENLEHHNLQEKLLELNKLYSNIILARAKDALQQFRRGPTESILAVEKRLQHILERLRQHWHPTDRDYHMYQNMRLILTNSTSETLKKKIDQVYARCQESGRQINSRYLAEQIHEWENEMRYTHTHRPMQIEIRQTSLAPGEEAPDRASAYAKIRKDDRHEARPASRPDTAERRPSKSPFRLPDSSATQRHVSADRPVLKATRPSSRDGRSRTTSQEPKPWQGQTSSAPKPSQPWTSSRSAADSQTRMDYEPSYRRDPAQSDRRSQNKYDRDPSRDRRHSRDRSSSRSRYAGSESDRRRDSGGQRTPSWSRDGSRDRNYGREGSRYRDDNRDNRQSRYERHTQDRQRYQRRDQSEERRRSDSYNRPPRYQSPEWARREAKELGLQRGYAHRDGGFFQSDSDAPGQQGWKKIYRTPSLNRYAVRGDWAPKVREHEYRARQRTLFPASSQRTDFIHIILGDIERPAPRLPWRQQWRSRTPSNSRPLN